MRLIFDSGKMRSSTFFKNKNLKKGGGKGGGRQLYLRCRNDYVKKCKNDLGNSHQSLILWYIWSEPTFGKAAPPFIFILIEWKNKNVALFRGRTQYSWVPRWRCPPFLNFWKVQNIIYKFCMYHFSSKCVVFALETQVLKTNQPSYYGQVKNFIMQLQEIKRRNDTSLPL